MKKPISFIILLALCISLFSCAKAPDIDSASPDLLVENNVQDPAPVIPEPQPEQPEQTPQQTPEQPEQPEKTPGDAPVTDETPVTDANPAETEQMPFTVVDKFSAYEVAVVLTDEETAKNKEYTIADFEGYDIFYVAHFSCYLEEYYPKYKDKRGLVLYLNEPSKERVLEYCDKLSKDPRVEVAEPNIYDMYQDKIYVELTDEAKADFRNRSVDWFPEVDITRIFTLNIDTKDVALFLDKQDEHNLYLQIKQLIGNKYVKTARPVYYETSDNCIHMFLNTDVNPEEFIKEDFPEIQISMVYSTNKSSIPRDDGTEFYSYRMLLEESTKKIYKIAEKIEKLPLIDEAVPHSIGGKGYYFEKVTN